MAKNTRPLKLFTLIAVLSLSLCFVSREEYNEIRQQSEFDILDYEVAKEKVKYSDFNRKSRVSYSDEKKQILESLHTKPFLALEHFNHYILPEEFDWRVEKPDCIIPPLDQEDCGACYAFSSVAVLEARYCIKSNGKLKPILSQQDLISCSSNFKCDGGSLRKTWEYLQNEGVPYYQCVPYASAHGSAPMCEKKCSNPKVRTFYEWKAKMNSHKQLTTVEEMKNEIFLNGPVMTTLETYDDLAFYHGGVYVHQTGARADDHAVAVYGWGVKDGKPFWIMKGSHGTDWGEQGFFKVYMGMYDVDTLMISFLPDI
jgi:C1A family cysteine protease